MAAVDSGQRPVAGLAGSIELLHEPRAGRVLELAAELEHVDADSVEYRGTAYADGTPVMRLKDCVGPMVQLGAMLATEIPSPETGRWVPGTIRDMKLRAFIPPGTTLQLQARLKQRSPDSASLTFETRTNKGVIATAGLVLKAVNGV
jgi:hypothetical protein